MASKQCLARLQKEYKALLKEPVPHCLAHPTSNLLEWIFVLEGVEKTPYEGGYYMGKIVFPPQFPFKPPSISMMTPSGRFAVNQQLCMSMTNWHPESWNPMWTIGTILVGLLSFFNEEGVVSTGSITTTRAEKVALAASSLEYNVRSPIFRKLFPNLVELHAQRQQQQQQQRQEAEAPFGSPQLSYSSNVQDNLGSSCRTSAAHAHHSHRSSGGSLDMPASLNRGAPAAAQHLLRFESPVSLPHELLQRRGSRRRSLEMSRQQQLEEDQHGSPKARTSLSLLGLEAGAGAAVLRRRSAQLPRTQGNTPLTVSRTGSGECSGQQQQQQQQWEQIYVTWQ
mmetsp:Transcript_2540/g.5812  ORF Transcript_2540/g.5812 Transcript_2540/m.5812 type:complete len:338 (-) Transcript_2540:1025-2038(-)